MKKYLASLFNRARSRLKRKRKNSLVDRNRHLLDNPPISAAEKERLLNENFEKFKQDVTSGSPVWESMPSNVELAQHNRCNLHCIMCHPDKHPPLEEMSDEEFSSAAAEIFPTTTILTPHSGGEPLLGNFEFTYDLCEKYKTDIELTTNATLLTPDVYRKISSRLSCLFISMDSHIKEIYERIRVGAKYEKVVENIRSTLCAAAGDPVESILITILNTYTVGGLPDYIRFAKDLGATSVGILGLHINFDELKEIDVSCTMPANEVNAKLDEAIQVGRETGLNIYIWSTPPRLLFSNDRACRLFNREEAYILEHCPSFCFLAATQSKILSSGEVYPCCLAPKELLMGNLKHEPLRKILNNDKFRQLRREMFTGKYNSVCASCYYSNQSSNFTPEITARIKEHIEKNRRRK